MSSNEVVVIRRSGFAAVPFWVVEAIGSKGMTLFVYTYLCALSNYETRITTSSWTEVIGATGLGKSTVMRAMAALRECGAVVRVGDEMWLPLDGPSSGTKSQKRDQLVPVAGPAPFLHKDSKKDYAPEFEELWNFYPKKRDKGAAFEKYNATLKRGVNHAEIVEGVEAYVANRRAVPTETEFYKNLCTLLSKKEPWREYVTPVFVPTPVDLYHASLVDDFDATGRWTGKNGGVHQTHPHYSGIPSPDHPEGGLFDATGRRYTNDPFTARRRYTSDATRAA